MKNFIRLTPILFVLLFTSCSKENESIDSDFSFEKDPIMTFSTWQDFYSTYEQTTRLNDTELSSWITSQGHTSLAFSKNSSSKVDGEFVPRGLQAILNEDQAFMVEGNFIVLYKQNFYEFTKEEFTLFKAGEGIFEESNIIGQITFEKNIFQTSNDSKLQIKSTTMNAADIAGSYQKEFVRQGYIPCAGGANQGTSRYKFKYVHELVAVKVFVGYPNVITELYLDMKLEYHNGSWNNAGEDRNITVNISGMAENTSNNPGYTEINISKNISCVNRNQRLFLAYAQYPSNFGPEPDWIVSVSGVITQHMNGDTSNNKWSNYVNW